MNANRPTAGGAIHRRGRKPRGFLVIDAVIGIFLALAVLMIMTALVVKQQHAERRLGAIRAVHRQAEAAMLALQAGLPAPAEAQVETLQDAAPPGYRWQRLTIPANQGTPAATLVGLIPAAAGGRP